MDNKEAIAVLKSNYPHGRSMLSEAVDLSIKALEAMELVPTPNKPSMPVCPKCYGVGTIDLIYPNDQTLCPLCEGSGKPAHVG